MDTKVADALNQLTEQMALMSTQIGVLSNKVQTLETNQTIFAEPNTSRPRSIDPTLDFDPEVSPHTPQEPRRPQHRDQGYIHRDSHQLDPVQPNRRPQFDMAHPDDQYIRNIKLDAPTFDGTLDPKMYIDWEGSMDQYFEWYEMTEVRKFKFAKTRLVRQARLYWNTLERMLVHRGIEPVTTWESMKIRLKEKYVPMTYKQKLIDQWQNLRQGSGSVTDYIAKFDEFVMRCHLAESEECTLSRFRAGLRDDIKRELYFREVVDLDHAYHIARSAESYSRSPQFVKSSVPPNRPGLRPAYPNQPRPSPPIARSDDKGKAPEIQKTSRPVCFRCQKPGHYASTCPTRTLHIGEVEEESPESSEDVEEEVYEADPALIDGYEEEDLPDEPDLLGVVRCILSQTKVQEDWRRTNILQTFFKLGDKICKVIIDSGSCVNAISASAVKTFVLSVNGVMSMLSRFSNLDTVPLLSDFRASTLKVEVLFLVLGL